MAVDNTGVIDVASIDPDGNVVLTISDHLPWDAENEHLLILQEKINTYIGAIEGGELYQVYPNAKEKPIVIGIYALHEPNDDAQQFLNQTKEILTSAGYGFVFIHGPFDVGE